MYKISVVIPTFDRREMLRATLESLVAQRIAPGDFEVIVVDDGSTDGTGELVAQFADRLPLRYRWLERDLADVAANGYCVPRVRNAGAALASAPILVLLDSGVVAGPDMLTAYLAEHERAAAAGTTCVVVGYVFGYHRLWPLATLETMLRTGTPEDVVAQIGAGPKGLDMRHKDFTTTDGDLQRFRVPWLMCWSASLSVRAEDFAAVGGFDERFHGWGVEDLELGYRLFRRGVRFVGSRAAWAIEWPAPRDLERQHRDAKRNIALFVAIARDPDVELFGSLSIQFPIRVVNRQHVALHEWREQARGLDLAADYARARPYVAGATGPIAVIGCGGGVPASWPASILVDFDADLLERAAAGTPHTPVHAIGMHTGLADGAADLVFVTSRLSGLWPRWCGPVLAEAKRIGRRTVVLFDDAPVSPPEASPSAPR
ncbi:glycosyltransferase [Luedemannella helvata]|uniref:Glycosyltransferase n=1 Tax=Luedemannella helvata TaxID=349315 RepID=A0ABN2KVC3_9ACTN